MWHLLNCNPGDYWEDALAAGRTVAKSYRKFEPDDIAGAILLDLVENPARYENLRGSLLFWAMKRAGFRYCQDQSSRYLYYSDQYTYSSEEVKKLLRHYYSPEVWPNGLTQPDWLEYDDVDEFKNDLEEWAEQTKVVIDMFDLEFALTKLRDSHIAVIQKKYRDGDNLTKSEQNKHSKAVRLLTYYVNEYVTANKRQAPWDHEGPGARRAMSNDYAQFITRYEGGFEGPDREDPVHTYHKLMRSK
ncbi:hypothetical protein ACFWY5_29630 [Nonomuraea sp. NPDC059007]|uniref:hypothetical protein n=1 Tax=Nonomuraea sp. NPDC059007 TaxID=3346692 RepID=UPI0036CB7661